MKTVPLTNQQAETLRQADQPAILLLDEASGENCLLLAGELHRQAKCLFRLSEQAGGVEELQQIFLEHLQRSEPTPSEEAGRDKRSTNSEVDASDSFAQIEQRLLRQNPNWRFH